MPAKRVGVVSISLQAGTAQFIADMDAAQARVGTFGSSTKQSMVASSAALRELEGNFGNNQRAIARFISSTLKLGPALQAAFPLVGGLAFGTMLFELKDKIEEFFKKVREAPEAISNAFRQLNAPLRLTNDELRIANDRLENDIAKLEGKRQNTLKLALDDAAKSADKLAESLEKDLESLRKLFKEQEVGGLRRAFGEAGLGKLQDMLTDLEHSVNAVTDRFGAKVADAVAKGDKKAVDALKSEEIRRIVNLYTDVLDKLKNVGGPTVAPGKVASNILLGTNLPILENTEVLDRAIRGFREHIQDQLKNIPLTVQNEGLTGKKQDLEAKNAGDELTRPFEDRMAALNAKLEEAKLKLAAVGKSEAFQSQAKAAGEALIIIAEVNKILEKQHTSLTTAQQDQIKNIVLDTERTLSQAALDQKMDESIKKIRDQVQTQELLTAAIGRGYEATKKAAVETQVMATLGAERNNDETLAAQRALLRVALAHDYDVKHAADMDKQVDALSDQIQLEHSLAEVQMQGAEAVRLVTLAYRLRQLVHDGATPAMIKAEIDLANATKATAAAADLAKIEQRIAAIRRLAAAQVEGAEAARKAELESKRQEAIFSGKTVAEADKEVQEAQLKHEQEIAQRALDRGLTYKNQLETLKQEEEELDKAAKITGETFEIELARRSIQKERLQLLVQETLEGRKAMDGVRAFFLEMQQQAKSAAQIIYDTLNSAVDRLSDQFAKFATGQKTNFREMLRGLAEGALRESFKSGLQTVLGNIGKTIGGPLGGVLQKASGANKRDGQERAKALYVELANSAGGAALGKNGNRPDGSASNPFYVIMGSSPAVSIGSPGGSGRSASLGSILGAILLGIPGRAGGGDVNPSQAYWVGETGPELLLGASGRIASHTESKRIGGGDTHFHDYYVDARGSEGGTEQRVGRAVSLAHTSAIANSVRANSDRARRVPPKSR